jgi:hypothetical protein
MLRRIIGRRIIEINSRAVKHVFSFRREKVPIASGTALGAFGA